MHVQKMLINKLNILQFVVSCLNENSIIENNRLYENSFGKISIWNCPLCKIKFGQISCMNNAISLY